MFIRKTKNDGGSIEERFFTLREPTRSHRSEREEKASARFGSE
jgi:hypothetical protein